MRRRFLASLLARADDFAPDLPAPVAEVMVRPFRTYAALAREERDLSFHRGVLRLLFVLGAFVAITATGRLAPAELLTAIVTFAYVPAVQALALGVALRTVAPEQRLGHAFALYLVGHGPYFLLFLLVAGGCLLLEAPARVLFRAAAPLAIGTFAWGALLTFACFRGGLALSRRRAAVATGLFYLVALGTVLAYFIAAGQLLPILPPGSAE
jgi:hypothetical protein